MRSASYWISHLNLQPHPEGGFFKETYRASENISKQALPQRFAGDRCFSTAIYFLLRSQDISVFHRIKSDEMWHFYAGTSLSIYVLTQQELTIHKLGANVDKHEELQVVIPANSWFGAKVNEADSYTLAGCTVAPGFDFTDFEMAERTQLLRDFPAHQEVIELLTKA